MQLPAIRAFVTIVDTGSFRAAAQQLHLSQPAVSKRLATLEQQLGHALLDRIGRRTELTEAGQTYLPHARRLLHDLEDGQRALEDLSGNIGGTLHLALSHHVGLHRMPPVLRRFIEHYPQVELDIEFLGSEHACEALVGGKIELALVTLPRPPAQGLRQQPIWHDTMHCMAAPGHPLARRGQVDPQELAIYPALLPDTDTTTYAIIANALAPYGVTPHTRLSSRYLETIKMLAAVGMGWTVLPESMLDDSLVALSLPDAMRMQRDLGYVHHPGRHLGNAASALLDMLNALAPAV